MRGWGFNIWDVLIQTKMLYTKTFFLEYFIDNFSNTHMFGPVYTVCIDHVSCVLLLVLNTETFQPAEET